MLDKIRQAVVCVRGPGSPHQLYAELLKNLTGIEMLHVPYKGNAPALTDVLAGHVPLMFSDAVVALPQIRTGSCARSACPLPRDCHQHRTFCLSPRWEYPALIQRVGAWWWHQRARQRRSSRGYTLS